MTPKEKAEDLLDKMNVIHHLKGNGLPVSMHKSQIKQCALVAVDDILNIGLFYNVTYWTEVKQEIKNL